MNQESSEYDQQPAKPVKQLPDYSSPPNGEYRPTTPQSNMGAAPNVPYAAYPPKRDFFLWLILGICTCGIGGLVYFYHNFNDVRNLEMITKYQSTDQMMRNRTNDPAIALLVYFICSPIAYIMKYSNLNDYLNFYGNRYTDPAPATPGKLIGVWALTFFTFIFGIFIIPLLFVAFAMIFYIIYLEKQWQDSLNFQIDKTIMYSRL
ncbi:MAG: hypothetical protein GPJ54_18490 [Candidatus Heimdallarchaeota archaeon]|nr:hypothetical protein [Candidatus Heimdallarchaeota archaeon]